MSLMSHSSASSQTVRAELDVRAVLAAVDTVLGRRDRPVALHEPRFGARERELVLDCIDTNWVSSAGKYVTQFEQMVAAATGARMPSPSSTAPRRCTPRCCSRASRPTTRCMLPSITFVATANAVSHAGAIPHFVEFELGYAGARSGGAGRASCTRSRCAGTANA